MIKIAVVPAKAGKVQLNLYLSSATVAALESLAAARHLRGKTQMAEIILEEYLTQNAAGEREPEYPVAGPAHQKEQKAKPRRRVS